MNTDEQHDRVYAPYAGGMAEAMFVGRAAAEPPMRCAQTSSAKCIVSCKPMPRSRVRRTFTADHERTLVAQELARYGVSQ